MPTLLETQNVKKIYTVGQEKIFALRGVDIQIQEGEFVSIVGKSGSGKSTLMHILGLLDTPTEGKVVINGTDTTNFSEKELARLRNKEIGFVFQSYNLLQRTTSLDNVILPLKYSKVPKAQWNPKALEMLNTVGLSDRIHNRSNELSGGQKQRVAIARALVTDPSIILADEPTGNLDTKTGEEIERLLISLNEKGKTIVLVTHDVELAKISKRQIILKDGLVVDQ